MGLREDKKEATRHQLIWAAVDLFEERGFDNVAVAEVAEAAGVSKMTVFNYFDAKEDLVTGVAKHHIGEPAAVVRARPIGTTPHEAMRDFFLASLAERQPFTGLNDDPDVLRIGRLVTQTPALLARMLEYRHESERLLADALIEESSSEFTARVIAAQIHATQQVLADENRRRIYAGEAPDAVYPDAVSGTKHAYRLLEHGLGNLFRRTADGKSDTEHLRRRESSGA